MFSNQRSSKGTQASNTLSSEKKAALCERVAQLMSPEEHTQLLNDFQENVTEAIAICQKLLDSSNRTLTE